jgi:hypothetical protein
MKVLRLLLLLNIVLIFSACLEQVNAHQGLGWDGRVYARMIRQELPHFFSGAVDNYYIHRILPPAIIFAVLKVLNLHSTDQNIILAFTVYNILLLNLCLLLWYKIAPAGILNSAALLLLNFCALKFFMFVPVLTDCTVFTAGVVLLYAYKKKNDVLLLITAILSAFCHPLLLPLALILYVLPCGEERPLSGRLFRPLPFILSFGYLAAMALFYVRRPDLVDAHLFQNTDPVDRPLFFLSVACSALYLFIIVTAAVKVQMIERCIKNVNWKRVAVAAGAVIVIAAVKNLLSHPGANFGAKNYLLNFALQTASDPFEFVVSHFLFFGLIVILIPVYFKTFVAEVSRAGTGFAAFTFAGLLLMMGSESRQYVFILPFLVFPLAGKLVLKWLPAAALILSKVWLPIGRGLYDDTPIRFPDQWLFMNMGPWITRPFYLLFMAVAAACFIVFIYLSPKHTIDE